VQKKKKAEAAAAEADDDDENMASALVLGDGLTLALAAPTMAGEPFAYRDRSNCKKA